MQSLEKDGSGYTAALGANSSLTRHFSHQNTFCFRPHVRRHLGSAGAAPGFASNLGYKTTRVMPQPETRHRLNPRHLWIFRKWLSSSYWFSSALAHVHRLVLISKLGTG